MAGIPYNKSTVSSINSMDILIAWINAPEVVRTPDIHHDNLALKSLRLTRETESNEIAN